MHGAMEGAAPRPLVAVTLDLHDGDSPDDVRYAAEWLHAGNVRGTFFVPSTLFASPRYQPVLRHVHALGHEVGSHSHQHDWTEVRALMEGDESQLGFLRVSRERFADFFGRAPAAFRAPCWCRLGPAAQDQLAALGYRVDSSCTPQRPTLLGSMPFAKGWFFSPRRAHYLRPGLLELPTSTLLLPAGANTFRALRRRLSLALTQLLLAEARVLGGRVVVMHFHAEDFNPNATPLKPLRRLRLSDFALRRSGGFGFRHFLADRDWKTISATTKAVVGLLAENRCVTMGAAAEMVAVQAPLRLAQA